MIIKGSAEEVQNILVPQKRIAELEAMLAQKDAELGVMRAARNKYWAEKIAALDVKYAPRKEPFFKRAWLKIMLAAMALGIIKQKTAIAEARMAAQEGITS